MNEEEMRQDPVPAPEDQGGGNVGPIIGVIIIIIVLVIGGFYYWGQSLSQQETEMLDDSNLPTAEEVLNEANPAAEALGTQGSGDEVSEIEEDLDTTDLDALDAEFEQLEEDFGF